MDEVKLPSYQRRAKEAKDVYDILSKLYPGKPLRIAIPLGIKDRILGYKEKRLLYEFYSSKM